MRTFDKFPVNGVLMNVAPVAQEILVVTDSMISETPLPDFASPAENLAESMRRRTFDELDGMLQRNAASRGE